MYAVASFPPITSTSTSKTAADHGVTTSEDDVGSMGNKVITNVLHAATIPGLIYW